MDAGHRKLLRFVVRIHRSEMERHQKQIGNVFYWTVTIILGLGIAVIQLIGSDHWTSFAPKWPLRVIVSTASLAIAVLAITEIIKRLSAYDSNARVVVKASELLSLFQDDVFGLTHPAIYEQSWRAWGDRNHPAHKFVPWFHVVVLLCMGLAVALLVWNI
jgi:hypothetical protein